MTDLLSSLLCLKLAQLKVYGLEYKEKSNVNCSLRQSKLYVTLYGNTSTTNKAIDKRF